MTVQANPSAPTVRSWRGPWFGTQVFAAMALGIALGQVPTIVAKRAGILDLERFRRHAGAVPEPA